MGPTTVLKATFAYDALGRRIEFVNYVPFGGETTRYYYDGLNEVAEFNDSDYRVRYYVHGVGLRRCGAAHHTILDPPYPPSTPLSDLPTFQSLTSLSPLSPFSDSPFSIPSSDRAPSARG